jgi:DNA repair exonuclease SbcCD nuclease subunit
MKAFRFLHTADLHLDSPFIGMAAIPEGIRDHLRQSTFAALANLVELAIQQEVDFILISGDIYDLADRSLRAQIRFQKALQRLALSDISVYIVHGNHDPEDGRAAKLTWPEHVHFFSSQEVECLPVVLKAKGLVATISGISYATAAITDNLALRIEAFGRKAQVGQGLALGLVQERSDTYRIGLLHTNVDGELAHANYAPCSIQDLLSCGMDYWALGHVHTRQVLHPVPAIVYPGNIQGRNVRETGAKGCYIVDVSEFGESKLAFHQLDAIRWFQHSISIQGIQTEQALKERLEQTLDIIREEADGRGAVVRLILTGRGPVHAVLQKGTYLAELVAELREEESMRVAASGDSVNGTNLTDFVWIESVQVNSGLEIDKALLLEQQSFLGDLLRLSEGLFEDAALFEAFCAETIDSLFVQSKASKHLALLGQEDRAAWLRAAQELAIDYLAADEGWDE